MRRVWLAAIIGVLVLAGCGIQHPSHRLWVTSSNRVGVCVSSDCGPWSVNLNWQIPTFPGQTGYWLFLNGSQVGSTASSPFTFTGSDCGTTNTLGVEAHDGSGSHGPLWTTSYSSPACTSGQLTVSGSKLVANGAPVHLHGVDVEGTEYQCAHNNGIFDTSNSSTNAANMASWHINFVRIGLNALCVDCALGAPTAYCGSNYMTPIESWVNLLNSDGIFVEVMLMWDLPGNSSSVGLTAASSYQLGGGPTEDHAPAAWATMAQDFAGDPMVMLGIWGEDYDNYSCKLNGGPTCNGVQGSVETTTLSSTASSGPTTSITVSSLGYTLAPGEPIWLGAPATNVSGAADTLTVAGSSNISPSGSSVTIPVTGTLSTTYAPGSTLYYSNDFPGGFTGVTPWLYSGSGGNPVIDWQNSTAGAQQAVTIMRNNGFTGPIVYTCADAANVCSNPSTQWTPSCGAACYYSGGDWLDYMPTDPDNEIVAASDLYTVYSGGNQTCSGYVCYNNTISPIISQGHPFIVNEAGPSTDGSYCGTANTTDTGGLLPWMDANGASGYAMWSWFSSDNPATDCLDLVASYTSATPNSNGAYAAGIESYFQTNFPANP